MDKLQINQLIVEKINQVVNDEYTRKFIIDILKIENTYTARKGRINEYEKALAEHVGN